MSGTITGLQFQKRNTERVNVFLDGEYAFALNAIEAASLRKGQQLSDADIAEIQAKDQKQKAFDRAVRFLGHRPRSRTELERYLKGKGADQEVIIDVLAKMEQAGYVDDEAFAHFWIENRVRFRPRSQRALKYELRQKGVNQAIIDNSLGNFDDEEAAWQAAEHQLPRWAQLDDDQLRHKLTGYLQRRGFSYQTVKCTLEKARQALDEID